MEALKPPKTLKVYTLIKQSGATFSYSSGSTTPNLNIGVGFYLSKEEAEHTRTLEVLKDTTTGVNKPKWHVFELEFPNPIHEE